MDGSISRGALTDRTDLISLVEMLANGASKVDRRISR